MRTIGGQPIIKNNTFSREILDVLDLDIKRSSMNKFQISEIEVFEMTEQCMVNILLVLMQLNKYTRFNTHKPIDGLLKRDKLVSPNKKQLASRKSV